MASLLARPRWGERLTFWFESGGVDFVGEALPLLLALELELELVVVVAVTVVSR